MWKTLRCSAPCSRKYLRRLRIRLKNVWVDGLRYSLRKRTVVQQLAIKFLIRPLAKILVLVNILLVGRRVGYRDGSRLRNARENRTQRQTKYDNEPRFVCS